MNKLLLLCVNRGQTCKGQFFPPSLYPPVFQMPMTPLSFPTKLKFGWRREGPGSLLQGSWKFTSGGHGDQCVTWEMMMLTQHVDSSAILKHMIMTQVMASKDVDCAVVR